MYDAVHDPGRVASGVLALGVHLLFFALLVVGISWQKKVTLPVVVDLWEELPAPPRVEAPAPGAELKPAPPEPKPKAAPPPPKVETPPQPTQAEIELREKLRKQREEQARLLDEQKRIEAEKRRLEEEERQRVEAEKRRLEEEARQRDQAMTLAEELRKEEEAARKEQFRREEEARRLEEQRRRAAAAAVEQRRRDEAARKQAEAEEARRKAEADARAVREREVADYVARIRAKIQGRVVIPPNLQGNPQAIYQVTLLPGGEVLEAVLERSSGAPAYDAAVERAIMAAQPLPVPDDPNLFQSSFRVLELKFKPKE